MAQAKSDLDHPTSASEPMWELRSCSEADARWLAPRLAKGSLLEMDALSKFQPVSVLLQNLDRKAVISERRSPTRPVALLEVTPIEGTKAGAFWSALTDYIVASPWNWTFSDRANSVLNLFNETYPSLLTYADSRNEGHIKWLERVGFDHVEDLPQYGRKELPFKLFERRKTNV